MRMMMSFVVIIAIVVTNAIVVANAIVVVIVIVYAIIVVIAIVIVVCNGGFSLTPVPVYCSFVCRAGMPPSPSKPQPIVRLAAIENLSPPLPLPAPKPQ